MKSTRLKTPEDYEIFSFRLTKEEKDSLNKEIEAVVDLFNDDLAEGQRKMRKNDVIMKALERGLAIMRRNKTR